MAKNSIKDLIKNIDKLEAEVNPTSESTTDQIIDIWCDGMVGSFHIIRANDGEILVANLNIPGQNFESLSTNTKTGRLAELVLEKVNKEEKD